MARCKSFQHQRAHGAALYITILVLLHLVLELIDLPWETALVLHALERLDRHCAGLVFVVYRCVLRAGRLFLELLDRKAKRSEAE